MSKMNMILGKQLILFEYPHIKARKTVPRLRLSCRYQTVLTLYWIPSWPYYKLSVTDDSIARLSVLCLTILLFFFVKLSFLLCCRILVLLIFRHKIVHVGFSLLKSMMKARSGKIQPSRRSICNYAQFTQFCICFISIKVQYCKVISSWKKQ